MCIRDRSGTTRVGQYQKRNSPTHTWKVSSFWILWGVGKITEASAPIIRLDATPFRPSMPPPPSSPQFYARCPSCRNLPNLSWLGTGTKYAGLHTWRLGYHTPLLMEKTVLSDSAEDISGITYTTFIPIHMHAWSEAWEDIRVGGTIVGGVRSTQKVHRK